MINFHDFHLFSLFYWCLGPLSATALTQTQHLKLEAVGSEEEFALSTPLAWV